MNDLGADALNNAIRALNAAWDDARGQWNDPSAHSFATQHIESLQQTAHDALDAIATLAQEIADAQRMVPSA